MNPATDGLRGHAPEFPSVGHGVGPPDSKRRPVRRVQLVFPPMVYAPLQSRKTAIFPLGLGYVAAVLEREGYEVSLVDCPTEGYDTTTDIGKDRAVYGLSPDELRSRIEEFRPDAIGISCLFSTMERRLRMVAQVAKEVDPSIVVVCGGPHVSAYYESLVRHDPAIDYCVMGEGETTILRLFQALNEGRTLEGIDGLCYRKESLPVVQPRTQWIEDLDGLPFPARHLVDQEVYFQIGKTQGLRLDGEKRLRIMQMTTSRGCPFQCAHCGKCVTWGKSYRTRSARNVLDEMTYLVEEYGVERFAFQDDNLTADMDRAAEIFDGMVERKLGITWEAHNGVGVKFLSPTLLEKMKASGCVSFTIAVESANEEILRRSGKPNYVRLAPAVVTKARELGIEVRGFFMIGFPGETLEEVRATVEYARGLQLAVSAFALVTPLPGTALYRECVDKRLIDESTVDFEDFSFGAFDLQLSEVPVEQLKAIRKVEWLKTVLLDGHGHLKRDIAISPEDAIEELESGLRLFPQEEEIKRLYNEAIRFYGLQKMLYA
jgi:anaerobic magnesium-protoporphyrin IX monomethyl ester cyclase